MAEASQDKLYATTMRTIGAVAKLPAATVVMAGVFTWQPAGQDSTWNALNTQAGHLTGPVATPYTTYTATVTLHDAEGGWKVSDYRVINSSL